MMELAVVLLLALALLLMTIANAVLAGSVPFLWWKLFAGEGKREAETKQLREDIGQVDEVVSKLMDIAGIKPNEDS